MSRVPVPDRAKSPFEVLENATHLARWVRELDYIRNFGLRIRYAREPKNWEKWSADSKAKWMQREADRIEKLRKLDEGYLADMRKDVEADVKRLLRAIASGNSYKWCKCIEEANRRLLWQDEAIAACETLLVDLTDIWNTLPINKNWLTQVEPIIEKQIKLLNGWKRGDSSMRKAVYEAEEERGKKIIQASFEGAAENMVLRAVYRALGIEEGNSCTCELVAPVCQLGGQGGQCEQERQREQEERVERQCGAPDFARQTGLEQ